MILNIGYGSHLASNCHPSSTSEQQEETAAEAEVKREQ